MPRENSLRNLVIGLTIVGLAMSCAICAGAMITSAWLVEPIDGATTSTLGAALKTIVGGLFVLGGIAGVVAGGSILTGDWPKRAIMDA